MFIDVSCVSIDMNLFLKEDASCFLDEKDCQTSSSTVSSSLLLSSYSISLVTTAKIKAKNSS